MKHISKISIFLLAFIVFAGCQNEDLSIDLNEDTVSMQSSTRAIVSPKVGSISISNPDLYDNWENITTIRLNGGGTIDAPWVYNPGNTMNIPDDVRMDIKKDEGWMMLGHTMTEQESMEPNYIFFYHRKSGILKGFYFNRTAATNQNVKWVIEAKTPSSIIPSNTKEFHLVNEAKQLFTTSNILKSSAISDTGALLYGWNSFTYELPYGAINNNDAIIDITGYNELELQLKAKGNLSGQVIVPRTVTSNSLDSWKSHLNMVSSLTSAASSFKTFFEDKKSSTKSANKEAIDSDYIQTRSILGTIGLISTGVSIVSNLFGAASFFTSKTENVTQRYNFSGDVNLTGDLAGLVVSANNIEINKLNDNNSLGVWGLKKLPEITIDKYGMGMQKYDDPNLGDDIINHYRVINLSPSNIKKETVEINPSLLPLIKEYTVTTSHILSSKEPLIQLSNSKEIGDWYYSEIPNGKFEKKVPIFVDGYQTIVGRPVKVFYLSSPKLPATIYTNVQVHIEYIDGSHYSSSRLFKVKLNIIDNRSNILNNLPNNVTAFLL